MEDGTNHSGEETLGGRHLADRATSPPYARREASSGDSASGQTPLSRTLDYAPRPRFTRQTRRLAGFIALVLLIAASWYWARPYWHQARVVWNERKLTAFKAPPGTVAFTNRAKEAKSLLAGGKHVRVPIGYRGSGIPYADFLAGYAPAQADELFDRQARQLRGTKLWGESSDPLGPPPTLFLGLRQPAGGKQRLVHVTLDLWWGYVSKNPEQFVRGPGWETYLDSLKENQRWSGSQLFWRLTLLGEVYAPATLRPGSARTSVLAPDVSEEHEQQLWPNRGSDPNAFVVPARMSPLDDPSGVYPTHTTLRILYGQPDPASQSRILIPYECDGEKGRFVGTVKSGARGDTIEWQVEGPVRFWPRE